MVSSQLYFYHLVELLRTSNALKESALDLDGPEDASLLWRMKAWIEARLSATKSCLSDIIKALLSATISYLWDIIKGILKQWIWRLARAILGFLVLGILGAVAGLFRVILLQSIDSIPVLDSNPGNGFAVLGKLSDYGGIMEVWTGFAVQWTLTNYGRIVELLTGVLEKSTWPINCCGHSRILVFCISISEPGFAVQWTLTNYGRIVELLTGVLENRFGQSLGHSRILGVLYFGSSSRESVVLLGDRQVQVYGWCLDWLDGERKG
ncbi:uncharacterized protein LOC124258444 isoform X2 [Haliotis rubra]|uniref:uncharacterized protein LOC124258444 isoform X2 n=1 Tax=Haliotis rubra TaxID=36100 RepID=UPI001EE58D5F|nr:uncharacterized protein LOC124258444 isoform X2 [Haliotis rubra]